MGTVKLEAVLADSAAGSRVEFEFLNLVPTRLSRQELIDLPYWMDVKCTVRTPERNWTGSGPVMTAQDLDFWVAQLLIWAGWPEMEQETEFFEPTLTVVKKRTLGPTLRIDFGFSDDYHPNRGQEDPLWVSFEIAPEDLVRFAGELRNALTTIAPTLA